MVDGLLKSFAFKTELAVLFEVGEVTPQWTN